MSAVRIPALTKPTAAVIFLHGLGDSGHGWSFLASEAHARDSLKHVNFVFPNAPNRPVTANNGMIMPSWHDITRFTQEGLTSETAVSQLKEAVEMIRHFIEEQATKHGISSDRVAIGGFSQGGALTLCTSLLLESKHPGFVALSSYLPIPGFLNQNHTNANQDTAMFMAHGDADPVVPISAGRSAKRLLTENFKRSVTFKEYRGLQHSASPQEIEQVLDFFEKVVPQ